MFTWLQVVLCMQRSVHVMRESTHRDNTARYLFWITKATNKCMSVRIVNTLSPDSVYGMVMTKSHGRGLQCVISLKGRARQPLEFYMNGEMFSFSALLVHTVFVSCLLKSERPWFGTNLLPSSSRGTHWKAGCRLNLNSSVKFTRFSWTYKVQLNLHGSVELIRFSWTYTVQLNLQGSIELTRFSW